MDDSGQPVERRRRLEDSIPGKLDDVILRVADLERQMHENTGITREIRDMMIAGKVVGRLVKWGGGIAGGLTALWAAWHHMDK